VGDSVDDQTRRREKYWRIAGELNENPFMRAKRIASKVKISRKTVSVYLEEMYAENILIGPWMSLKPHRNYKEYVHLLKFSDPYDAFKGLKGFPHVLYRGMASGDWNTLLITDRLLDFSQLRGFECVVYQGVRGCVYTPKTENCPWDNCLKRMYNVIEGFDPSNRELKRRDLAGLEWGEDEWKLYSAFRANVRKKITPVLKKIRVRHEAYQQWMETLEEHCSIQTEFYPDGFYNYVGLCFLLDSDYEETVKRLFSFFPATSVVMEVGSELLVFVKADGSDMIRDLICMVIDMETVGMVNSSRFAVMVFENR